MRFAFLLGVFGLCLWAHAQNWALLNPAYRYNYSNDGTDTISNQIRVMQVDTLGVDSFRYELNRIGVVSENSGNYFSECDGQANSLVIRPGQAQFLGASLLKQGPNWFIESSDTLRIIADAAIGSSWVQPDGSVATVFLADTATILGLLDSLKCVGSSDGDTLELAKNHGIVRCRSGAGGFSLVGIGGALSNGAQFPTYRSLFDYQVGDVLQYHSESEGLTGNNCLYTIDEVVKHTILQRNESSAETVYMMRQVHSRHYSSVNLFTWLPCGAYDSHWVDTVEVAVDHDFWSSENPFCQMWHMAIWPGSVSAGDAMLFPNEESYLLLSSRLDTVERYVLEAVDLLNEETPHSVLCPSIQDPAILLTSGNIQFTTRFRDGVGLEYEQYYYFEGGNYRELVGYEFVNDAWGTISSDGLLLGVDENQETESAVRPNPTSDFILISSTPGTACSITDLQGRVILQERISSSNERINVQALPPGVYLLKMEGMRPQRFVIAR